MKNFRKAFGGEGTSSASTPRRWNANPTEELSCFSGRPRWNHTSEAIDENAVVEAGLLRELLDRGDVVAHEADEDGLRRRLAVDPVFDIVAIGITLTHFAVGLPDRGNKFLAVHAYHGPAVLNGLFHFRLQRIEPLHGSGTLFRKIQERRKDVLQFVRRDVRERLVEFPDKGGAHARLHPRRARIPRPGAPRGGGNARP